MSLETFANLTPLYHVDAAGPTAEEMGLAEDANRRDKYIALAGGISRIQHYPLFKICRPGAAQYLSANTDVAFAEIDALPDDIPVYQVIQPDKPVRPCLKIKIPLSLRPKCIKTLHNAFISSQVFFKGEHGPPDFDLGDYPCMIQRDGDMHTVYVIINLPGLICDNWSVATLVANTVSDEIGSGLIDLSMYDGNGENEILLPVPRTRDACGNAVMLGQLESRYQCILADLRDSNTIGHYIKNDGDALSFYAHTTPIIPQEWVVDTHKLTAQALSYFTDAANQFACNIFGPNVGVDKARKTKWGLSATCVRRTVCRGTCNGIECSFSCHGQTAKPLKRRQFVVLRGRHFGDAQCGLRKFEAPQLILCDTPGTMGEYSISYTVRNDPLEPPQPGELHEWEFAQTIKNIPGAGSNKITVSHSEHTRVTLYPCFSSQQNDAMRESCSFDAIPCPLPGCKLTHAVEHFTIAWSHLTRSFSINVHHREVENLSSYQRRARSLGENDVVTRSACMAHRQMPARNTYCMFLTEPVDWDFVEKENTNVISECFGDEDRIFVRKKVLGTFWYPKVVAKFADVDRVLNQFKFPSNVHFGYLESRVLPALHTVVNFQNSVRWTLFICSQNDTMKTTRMMQVCLRDADFLAVRLPVPNRCVIDIHGTDFSVYEEKGVQALGRKTIEYAVSTVERVCNSIQASAPQKTLSVGAMATKLNDIKFEIDLLIVVPTINLAASTAAKFGAAFYLDVVNNPAISNYKNIVLRACKRLVICVNSVHKLGKNIQVKHLLMDEMSVSFRNFKSNLMDKCGVTDTCSACLFNIMERANQVTMIDADLSDIETKVVEEHRPNSHIEYLYNSWCDRTATYRIVDKEKDVLAMITYMAYLLQNNLPGKIPLLVFLSSTELILPFYEFLHKSFPDIKIAYATSEKTSDIKVTRDTRYWEKYDILIFSPVVGAGISYNARFSKFRQTILILRPGCNLPVDCLQQIHRARTCPEILIFVCQRALKNALQQVRKVDFEKMTKLLIGTTYASDVLDTVIAATEDTFKTFSTPSPSDTLAFIVVSYANREIAARKSLRTNMYENMLKMNLRATEINFSDYVGNIHGIESDEYQRAREHAPLLTRLIARQERDIKIESISSSIFNTMLTTGLPAITDKASMKVVVMKAEAVELLGHMEKIASCSNFLRPEDARPFSHVNARTVANEYKKEIIALSLGIPSANLLPVDMNFYLKSDDENLNLRILVANLVQLTRLDLANMMNAIGISINSLVFSSRQVARFSTALNFYEGTSKLCQKSGKYNEFEDIIYELKETVPEFYSRMLEIFAPAKATHGTAKDLKNGIRAALCMQEMDISDGRTMKMTKDILTHGVRLGVTQGVYRVIMSDVLGLERPFNQQHVMSALFFAVQGAQARIVSMSRAVTWMGSTLDKQDDESAVASFCSLFGIKRTRVADLELSRGYVHQPTAWYNGVLDVPEFLIYKKGDPVEFFGCEYIGTSEQVVRAGKRDVSNTLIAPRKSPMTVSTRFRVVAEISGAGVFTVDKSLHQCGKLHNTYVNSLSREELCRLLFESEVVGNDVKSKLGAVRMLQAYHNSKDCEQFGIDQQYLDMVVRDATRGVLTKYPVRTVKIGYAYVCAVLQRPAFSEIRLLAMRFCASPDFDCTDLESALGSFNEHVYTGPRNEDDVINAASEYMAAVHTHLSISSPVSGSPLEIRESVPDFLASKLFFPSHIPGRMSWEDLWNMIGVWGCVVFTVLDGELSVPIMAFARVLGCVYQISLPGDNPGSVSETTSSDTFCDFVHKNSGKTGFQAHYVRRTLPYAIYRRKDFVLSSHIGLDSLPCTNQLADIVWDSNSNRGLLVDLLTGESLDAIDDEVGEQ